MTDIRSDAGPVIETASSFGPALSNGIWLLKAEGCFHHLHISIGQPISERILRFASEIPIGPVLHGIIGEFRKRPLRVIESDVQLAGRRYLAGQNPGSGQSASRSRIPQHQDRIEVLLGIGKIQVAPCHQAKNRLLSIFPGLRRNRMEERLLGRRKGQVCLIAGGGTVSGVPFFPLQCFVQADDNNRDIRLGSHNHRLTQAVIFISKMLHLVRIERAAFGIQDPDALRKNPPEAFKNRDILAAGPVVVSDQGRP